MRAFTTHVHSANRLTAIRTFARLIFLIALFASCSLLIVGQRRIPNPAIAETASRTDQSLSSLEEEMRAKRKIAATNKAHRDNVNRARNLVFLSESLVRAYKEKNRLDRDDMKKLEKAENLVKSIREAAGGSDPDVEPDNLPTNLAAALSRLSELAESLKERVEKTPKRVVSAAIIDEANVLLELIRLVRSMQARA